MGNDSDTKISINKEINKHKETVEEFKSNQENYKKLFNNLNGMIYRGRMLKNKWMLEILNDFTHDLTGYDMDSFISGKLNWFAIIHPDDINRVSEKSQSLTKVCSNVDLEYRILKKDGNIAWITDIVSSFFKNGKFDYIDGIMFDITDRKKNEERMNYAEKIAKVGSWDWDIKTEKLWWSDETFLTYGFKAQEFEPSYKIFEKVIHPDDKDFVNKSVNDSLEKHVPYNIENRIILPNGEVKWINSQGKVTKDTNGFPIKFSGVQVDITERKEAEIKLSESENQFQRLFNNLGDMIFVGDINNGAIIDANEQASIELGYTRQELLSMTIYDIDMEASKHSHKSFFWDKLNYDDKVKFEGMHKRKDGTSFPVEVNITLIDLDKRYLLGVIRNIKARKDAEKDKTAIQKQIFQSSKLASLGELSAGVGHEINNPLGIIMGHLERIDSKFAKFNPELKRHSTIINAASERIRKIVDGLRTFAGGNRKKNEIVNIHTSILSTINFVETIYKKENIIIETTFRADNYLFIGDRGKLQQVMLNLFTNSKDAMKGKAGILRIGTSNNGNTILINISDNGCGIKNENKDRIFDSFFTTKPVGSGTGLGLGLSISHSIVEEFGGKINVVSEFGIGTTFSVELPVLPEKGQPLEEEEEEEEEEEKLQGKVLIVEDEVDYRDFMCEDLVELGLDVDEADDGDTGLEKIKTNRYDYIITDLKMPRVSGDVLIKETRKLGGNEKIIVITGGFISDYTDEQRRMIRELADGFIKKPFSKKDTYRILKNCSSDKKP